jgi:stage II sporulation protein D
MSAVRFLVGLILLITVFLGLTTEIRAAKSPMVRVKVAETDREFVILPDDNMQVSCYRKGKLACNYHAYTKLTIRPNSKGMQLEQEGGVLEHGLDKIICTPRPSGTSISINGKYYRGQLIVLPDQKPGVVIAVNHVRLENYLKGVVPLEMGIKLITQPEDKEALKVQAVAARTYALAKLGQYPGRPYDLESTVADQVYGGVKVEEGIISRAIDKTRGEVLTNSGNLVKAYFHANCGGEGEAIEQAWPWKAPEHYLQASSDSEYCSWAPNYAWSASWDKNQIEKSINEYFAVATRDSGFSCGNLLDLRVIQQSLSGRILLLKVLTDRGEWEVKSDSIRWCFKRTSPAGTILPSTKFEIQIECDSLGVITVVGFSGFGNGHGVGMCQIGALGRARAGQTYHEILFHYYPGTDIEKRY